MPTVAYGVRPCPPLVTAHGVVMGLWLWGQLLTLAALACHAWNFAAKWRSYYARDSRRFTRGPGGAHHGWARIRLPSVGPWIPAFAGMTEYGRGNDGERGDGEKGDITDLR